MLFNSYIFIFVFFPLFVAGYFLLNRLPSRKPALWFVICMSLIFYGYNHVRYVPVIVSSILVNYAVSRFLSSGTLLQKEMHRKLVLALGIAFDLGLIFYFKYYDFFFENINNAFHTSFEMKYLLLPLGISFFTFQQVSFVVDSYRGETAGYGFAEYAAFVTFFPQLVAGPIVLHRELIPQFRDNENRRPDWNNLFDGAVRFSLGLFKKVMIADTFARAVDWGFTNGDTATSGDLLLVMLSYTFQIYFDFSGYSDMATGLSQMVNLKLPINFDSPYKSFTIREFWKRWHMTLTRFLTTYVYIPLGGNRRGLFRVCVNTFIVFLLSGIWHGANWTLILWGVLHGILCILERLFEKTVAKAHAAAQWFATFLTVNVLWLLFRAENITQWKNMMLKIVSFENLSLNGELLNTFLVPERELFFYLLRLHDVNAAVRGFSMILFMLAAFFICLCFENNYRRNIRHGIPTILLASCAFVWAVLSLGSESVFLYFNF